MPGLANQHVTVVTDKQPTVVLPWLKEFGLTAPFRLTDRSQNICIMKFFNKMVFLLALIMGALGVSHAQLDIRSLTRPELASYWLHNNCQTNEISIIQTEFSTFASEIEPLLIKAFENGPPQDEIKAIESTASKRYEQIQNSLKENETFGLSKGDVESFQKQTVQDYINAQKNSFINGYRSQALLGLAYTGSDSAITLLQKEAENKESPLTYTAQNALNILQENKKNKK